MFNPKKYKNLHVIDHPLLKHKITVMRDIKTGTSSFRRLVKEVAILEAYEALRNIPTEDVEIVTPLEKTMQPKVAGKKFCFVPIMRAGLGMLDGMIELVPTAKIGHVGIYRNPETNEPVQYYCKLPSRIADRQVFVIDTMLATGVSAVDAVRLLRKNGAKNITVISIIGAPEGIKYFCHNFPEVPLFIAAVDRELDEKCLIRPGLGDAGDRIFGTEK